MKKQSPFIFFPTKELLLPSDKYVRKVGDIVMRPSDGRVAIANVLTVEDPQECIPQYIYVLSNEKPKEGEWSYCPIHLGGKIFPAKGKGFICDNCKKIIATTNPELHTKKNPVHNENSYIDDVPKISQSDIEYIISIHNGDVKEVVGVEKLAGEYARGNKLSKNIDLPYQNGLFYGYMEGFKVCQSLQSNAGGFSELEKWIDEEIKSITNWTIIDRNDHHIQSSLLARYNIIKVKIQSLIKEQPKKDTVTIEYENICIQTGMPCGFPCIGDCNEKSIKMPKIKDGNILIVR